MSALGTNMETLLGGVPIQISFQDGTVGETIVRKLWVSELDQLMVLLTEQPVKTARLAELYTREKFGWSNKIANKSIYAINKEGARINEAPFAEHLAETESLGQEFQKVVLAGKKTLPSSLHEPALSPD